MVQNDLMQVILQVCKQNIEKEGQVVEFIAVMTDETYRYF